MKMLKRLLWSLLCLSLSHCRQEEAFYSNVLRSDVFVQQYFDDKYDFLWVMDGSASMSDRRDFVVNNMNNFLSILTKRKAIDYQMAVTNMDNFTTKGDLAQAPTGQKVVKSASSDDPAGEFGAIVNNIPDDPSRSFWEQGLETAYQAIFKHGTEFMRSGVPLILVFISDEDDYSCASHCSGVQPEQNTSWIPFSLDRYLSYFGNVKKQDNSTVHAFAITGTDYDTCPVPSIGTRYMEISRQLGGIGSNGSICDSSLKDSYENIARVIADRGVKFTLSEKASGNGINVYVDQKLIPFSPDNYVFDAETNSIIFTGAIPRNGSVIEVTYNRLTN